MDKQLPLPGQVFSVADRTAFLIRPATTTAPARTPWVWYAPTLPNYPGPEEQWMFEQFLAAGIAIAGIDTGESYGSPTARAQFTALHEHLTAHHGLARKPVLLARSRGGLMLYNWAAEHPDCVAAIAGIYPVCSLTSYPGLSKAAPAYHLAPADLAASLSRHNPIDRLAPLATQQVPIFHIHGDADELVPLEHNSGLLAERYRALGGPIELRIPPGQGHNMWTGFFQCRELADFVCRHAVASPRQTR